MYGQLEGAVFFICFQTAEQDEQQAINKSFCMAFVGLENNFDLMETDALLEALPGKQ